MDSLTVESWRIIRRALALARAHDYITGAEYDRAMSEVMGTSDKSRW